MRFDLKTRDMKDLGEYSISMVSGDEDKYLI